MSYEPEKIDGILRGYTVAYTSEILDLENHLKRTLDARVYELQMTGNRCLIGKDKADDMYKGILHKPMRARQAEENEMGSGWVIAVGPLFGAGNAPHPAGVVCEDPRDLLCKHVYFQMWAGHVLRTDDGDAEYESKDSLVIMTDRDIQAWEK